jgi:phosphotransferase system enzyme I (PtsI)
MHTSLLLPAVASAVASAVAAEQAEQRLSVEHSSSQTSSQAPAHLLDQGSAQDFVYAVGLQASAVSTTTTHHPAPHALHQPSVAGKPIEEGQERIIERKNFQQAIVRQEALPHSEVPIPTVPESTSSLAKVPTAHGASARKEHRREKEKRFRGIPAAQGIVIGRATTLIFEPLVVQRSVIAPEQISQEQYRFRAAVAACSVELQRLVSMALEEAPVAAPILEAQLLILNDPMVGEMICRRIETLLAAESAVQLVFDEQQQFLHQAQDAYLRERAMDLDNVKNRLLDHLLNRTKRFSERRMTELSGQYSQQQEHDGVHVPTLPDVTVADSLTPSDVMLLRKAGMKAFVTELSGVASHTAILARSLHIPAVIGVPSIANRTESGTTVIVDGYAGVVILHPKPETIAKYERRRADFAKREQKLGKLAKAPSVTSDGRRIHLFVNADTLDEIEEARVLGSEGIGLVRSELHIVELQRLPTEDEQAERYTELAEHAYPLPLTLRAFDIGSDKSFGLLPPEPNPALGLRGLRFLLKNKAAFMAQVRAVLRASQHRNVRLMLPMVTSVPEFQRALALIKRAKDELRSEGVLFDESLPVGAMIETPSAALMARELGALSDFFSIGTNDLVQYTLAADRLNTSIINVYDAFHPAVLRLMKLIVEAARFNNIPVAVCGEFAGHAAATELLVGLGIEELSVVPSALLELKKRIRGTVYSSAVHLVAESLECTSGTEVRKIIASTTHKSERKK